MNTVYYLETCNTCRRILDEWDLDDSVERRELKGQPLDEGEVDRLAELAGSYEALFSRRSRQYRAQGLHERELTEADYRDALLSHYSFLKRPVLVLGDRVFVGNKKSTVAEAKEALEKAKQTND